ncbi:hypothetical protein C0993_005970 [Termitomyces sp. T159_Od127]|nr:hypothetical protein C0993_005970 [Termitomyces sp. T159_Od127]
MRPKSISGHNSISDIPPLPAGKDVVDIFSDYYRYLYMCAKDYISESNAHSPTLWTSVESSIEYVLTHPNGWEGVHQQQLRRAAIKAGLVPNNDEAHARIRFVTEGEASLQFCICNGLTTEALKKGGGVLIIDAGGGTIDMCVYGEAQKRKDAFEELASPECYLQGSLYVTLRAKAFLQDFVKGTKFADDVEAMTAYFDKFAKQTFDGNDLFLKFGSARDTDSKLRIRGGRLTLLGEDVEGFFEPSISCIARAIEMQCTAVRKPVSAVFLVGGFSASNYLFSKLKEAAKRLDINLCRPHSNP